MKSTEPGEAGKKYGRNGKKISLLITWGFQPLVMKKKTPVKIPVNRPVKTWHATSLLAEADSSFFSQKNIKNIDIFYPVLENGMMG
ncbi:MAG: hypothetical protein GY754_45410 [bacterium]|nr:hypothetical protein [bacterium]